MSPKRSSLPVLSRLFTLKMLFLLRIICEMPAVAYINVKLNFFSLMTAPAASGLYVVGGEDTSAGWKTFVVFFPACFAA
jgi:hypothetical protein